MSEHAEERPLSDTFEIHMDLQILSVTFLYSVIEVDKKRRATRAVNALQRNGALTIRDALKFTPLDFCNAIGIGRICEEVLFDMLHAFEVQGEELIIRFKQEIIKTKMRERGYIK